MLFRSDLCFLLLRFVFYFSVNAETFISLFSRSNLDDSTPKRKGKSLWDSDLESSAFYRIMRTAENENIFTAKRPRVKVSFMNLITVTSASNFSPFDVSVSCLKIRFASKRRWAITQLQVAASNAIWGFLSVRAELRAFSAAQESISTALKQWQVAVTTEQ